MRAPFAQLSIVRRMAGPLPASAPAQLHGRSSPFAAGPTPRPRSSEPSTPRLPAVALAKRRARSALNSRSQPEGEVSGAAATALGLDDERRFS
jgi:hypothetical protein